MKYLYIIKVGETFPGTKEKLNDFESWILRFLHNKNRKIKVINILKDEKFPSLRSAKGFIITGSHDMVSDELLWSVRLEKVINKIAQTDIPLLGICYGHQLIAKALGGESGFNKKGKEIGVVKINQVPTSASDPLLEGFPQKFCAYETHYQTVIKLPLGAKVLAKNAKDSHQAVRYTKNIWGVQFHPEFDRDIMQEYILKQKDALVKLNFDVERLLSNLQRCDRSSTILTNFEKIVNQEIKR
ncbi:MAG: glutamine amidotransferase [Sulfurimonas sp.]|nr:glutamine amidotransferase [Sulfurimonas sp.]